MSLLPVPTTFGLPDKFSTWRKHQDEAVLEVVQSEQRVNLQVAPTGFGKSLSYIMMSILMGGRAVILTSTKGLQSQLLKDFETIGAVDVRGKNAYRCVKKIDGTMCDRGACVYGVKCPLRDEGCLYYDAIAAAKRAPIVITNYAFWMTINEHVSGGIGEFDFMVCDEAHDVPDTVSSYLTVVLDLTDPIIEPSLPGNRDLMFSMNVVSWRNWAKKVIVEVAEEIKAQKEALKYYSGDKKRLRRFLHFYGQLKRMVKMKDDWVIGSTSWSIEFAPKWPAPYCEEVLFLGMPRILLTSASVREKTAQMLGVKELSVSEYPHSFPKENRMLHFIPTVKMNYKITPEQLKVWVMRIDQILGPRSDRKGVIHTVSYARRDFVMAHSKFANQMITHQKKNTVQIVEDFKRSKLPLVLVSPSMTTGWDFPYSECEFQIIGKIAYPDLSNSLVDARRKDDPEYVPYVAMQQLVQACGRGVRAKDDSCENFIIDDGIQNFMKRFHKFAPKWFWEAYNERAAIPPPAPKL